MTTKPQSTTEETPVNVHALTVLVCQDCIDLKGVMCNNAECVFCRRTMVEVQQLLDAMLLCPIVDGKRLILVGDAVTSEDTRVPASAAPVVDQSAIKIVKGLRSQWLKLANRQTGWCQHVRAADQVLDALKAATNRIPVNWPRSNCPNCAGSGFESDSTTACGFCDGDGWVFGCDGEESAAAATAAPVEQTVYVSEHPVTLHCNTCGMVQVKSFKCPRGDGQLVAGAAPVEQSES